MQHPFIITLDLQSMQYPFIITFRSTINAVPLYHYLKLHNQCSTPLSLHVDLQSIQHPCIITLDLWSMLYPFIITLDLQSMLHPFIITCRSTINAAPLNYFLRSMINAAPLLLSGGRWVMRSSLSGPLRPSCNALSLVFSLSSIPTQ